MVAVLFAALFTPAAADVRSSDIEAQSRALSRAVGAVVGVQVQAVEDARSAATLGRLREGSGVVIDEHGLVLTIGYLVLEAETVQITTDDGRELPARVVAYDLATGFGLVQSIVPPGIAPAPLAPIAPMAGAAAVSPNEPLTIASGGATGSVSPAQLLTRRPFSGHWEYHLDAALFTTPPRRDQAGAGVFNSRGELLGVGSLFVTGVPGHPGPSTPANMFVPVELLPPILEELRERGASQASTRAWLGLNCVEFAGGVRVARVNPDSPADVAGLQPGDQILAIDGVAVRELATLWKTLWAQPEAERPVKLEIRRDDDELSLTVFSVDRAKTLRRSQGV